MLKKTRKKHQNNFCDVPSCGNVASVLKAPFISYSCISYFGHACLKLNLVLISHLTMLTGKCATQNRKKILVYGHVDILWT